MSKKGVNFNYPLFKFKQTGGETYIIKYCKCLIFFKTRPSLTTSKEGMKRMDKHYKQRGFDSRYGRTI